MKTPTVAKRVVSLATAYAVLLAYLLISNPQRVPSIMLVVPFILLFAALYFTIVEVISLLRADKEGAGGRHFRRPRLTAALGAAFPVLILVLKSIGQLSVWDIVTAGALVVVAYIYVTRSTTTLSR